MKKLIYLSLILVLFSQGILAQAPEKFNYQAVIRDNTGELLINQDISLQISILEGSSTGTPIFVEMHAVATNDYGIVNIKIGSVSGDLSSLSWESGDKFLKIEIDESGGSTYTELGVVQLLSVPYALYANSASNLGDENVYSPATDTLFVVKDYDGNVVFAVFPDGAAVYVNEGVKGKVGGFAVSGRTSTKGVETDIFTVTPDSTRIYVNDTSLTKGKVGGFAVSGRTSTKGLIKDYLLVTGDSTRIYVDSTTAKGKVGGFAVSGRTSTKGSYEDYLTVTKDSTRIYITEGGTKGKVGGFAVSGRTSTKEGDEQDYFNISGNTDAQTIDPSEARILWYPKKEAFLTGRVLVESPDSVGTNSMATGFESKSIGDYSQALGYRARAYGDNSTAIGNYANVDSANSYALGNNSYVGDLNSYAIGNGANVLGEGSYAIGSGAMASGNFSFAIGSDGVDTAGVATNPTKAIADYSYAFGMGSIASSQGAIAMGTQNTASGVYSTALGYKTSSSGRYSTTMGLETTASGDYSTTMGYHTTASKSHSTAMGYRTIASQYYSTAMGGETTASGSYSTSMGRETNASGHAAVAMGIQTTASGSASFAMGSQAIASGIQSIAMGDGAAASGDYSTAIGRGAEADTIYSTAIGLVVEARGVGSIALGAYSHALGYNSIAMGRGASASGSYSIAIGNSIKAKGYRETVIGAYNDTTYSIIGGDADPLFIIGNGTWNGNRINALMVLENGSMGVGGYPGETGTNIFALLNGDAPTASVVDGVLLYADNASAELKVRDEAGNISTLSPHNFTLAEKSEPMAWSFFSENENVGYQINVDMLKAIRTIENLSGEKLVYMQDLASDEMVTKDNQESLVEVVEQQKTEIEQLKLKNQKLEQKLNEILDLLEHK